MEERMEGWTGGRMEGQVEGWIDGQDGQMDENSLEK